MQAHAGHSAEKLEESETSEKSTVIADEHLDQSFEYRCAIGVTLNVFGSHRRQFRKDVEDTLLPHLAALNEAKRVAAVLPFHHRPLRAQEDGNDNSWTDYWIVVLAPNVEPNEIWHSIDSSAQTAVGLHGKLLRAEVLRLQPNIDMYYPRINDFRRETKWHWIEYVVSKAESRDVYYQDQYKFSGRVIRHFYESDAVRRSIGFERVRFLENNGDLPEWDVIHITGFAPVRLVQVMWHLWRFMPVFDDIARGIGYPSALAVFRSWDAKRVKYQRLAVQDRSYTLQPVYDPALYAQS